MAGQVPTTPPPGFGRAFAQQLGQADANRTGAVTATLDREAENFRSMLTNLEKIANVSGGMSIDGIGSAYAGQRDPLFGGDYTAAMDGLRLQQAQANVAATNRRGAGGGGGGGAATDNGPPRLVEFVDADGNVVMTDTDVRDSDMDVILHQWEKDTAVTGPDGTTRRGTIRIAPNPAYQGGNTGAPTTQMSAPPAGGDITPQEAPQTGNNGRMTFGDGSYVENGVAYTADGKPLGG